MYVYILFHCEFWLSTASTYFESMIHPSIRSVACYFVIVHHTHTESQSFCQSTTHHTFTCSHLQAHICIITVLSPCPPLSHSSLIYPVLPSFHSVLSLQHLVNSYLNLL
jgi:hypothetical protein